VAKIHTFESPATELRSAWSAFAMTAALAFDCEVAGMCEGSSASAVSEVASKTAEVTRVLDKRMIIFSAEV
jgi:F0F1-type ATP synthase membrane subunit c/vacuolar-type H+-ATPase subunit K